VVSPYVDPYPLPASVLDLVEFSPVEDIMLAILRQGFPDIPVFSLIPEDPPPHFVLVRRLPGDHSWAGDARFTDEGRIQIHTFTQDPDGDWKGAMLSEAARVILKKAWLDHVTIPGLGSIIEIDLWAEPGRVPDWATSTGPVQYADLPQGYWRYQSTYKIQIRKPRS
jgi:hypothetical protein